MLQLSVENVCSGKSVGHQKYTCPLLRNKNRNRELVVVQKIKFTKMYLTLINQLTHASCLLLKNWSGPLFHSFFPSPKNRSKTLLD